MGVYVILLYVILFGRMRIEICESAFGVLSYTCILVQHRNSVCANKKEVSCKFKFLK